MSKLFDAGQALARYLVVEHSYVPLEQAVPGLENVSTSFDGALAAFQGADLRVHAFILDEDAASADLAAEALRLALQSQEERIPGRIKAFVWVLVQTDARGQELAETFLNFEDGHFLSKTLVGRGVLCVDTQKAWSFGRLAALPKAETLAVHLDLSQAPDEHLAHRQLESRKADERQARRLLKGSATPMVWFLIALNVIVFGFQHLLAQSLQAQGMQADRAWNTAMLALGANDPAQTLGQHQFWRLATACFLHAGIVHIGMNMISLFSLGSLLERLVGPWRLLGLYTVCGLGASALSAALGTPGIPSLGASGAILGLAGALLAPHWRRDPNFPKDLSDRLFSWLARPVGLLFALGFGLQLLDLPLQLDNFAHLGGLLTGFAVAYIHPPFLIRKTRNPSN